MQRKRKEGKKRRRKDRKTEGKKMRCREKIRCRGIGAQRRKK